MSEKKKIKVRVKKRKLKIKRIIIMLLFLIILVLSFIYLRKLPIKNIYIIGNNIVSDKEIIEEAGISDYPSFICTSSSSIKNKLQKNDYIKEVTIKKKFWGKIYVYIKEEKILALYNNKLILEDGKVIDNHYNIM